MENAALALSLPAPYYLYSITFYKQKDWTLWKKPVPFILFFFLNSHPTTVVIFGWADYVPAASV